VIPDEEHKLPSVYHWNLVISRRKRWKGLSYSFFEVVILITSVVLHDSRKLKYLDAEHRVPHFVKDLTIHKYIQVTFPNHMVGWILFTFP
jgi:hypothetical protein